MLTPPYFWIPEILAATEKPYNETDDVFTVCISAVPEQDPQCAIAHWGIAMAYYHQLKLFDSC
jgi:hypothetical protein